MKMVKTVSVDMETKAVKLSTALNRFFKKFPELEYWRETFEYMNEHNTEFFSDNRLGDGSINEFWAYALHLEQNISYCDNASYFYIAVIERKAA